MIIQVDKKGNVESLQKIINVLLENRDVKGLLILSCDANGFSPEIINPVLKTISVPIIGGIFPSIIHGKEKMDNGTIVAAFNNEIQTHIIHGLSEDNIDYDEALSSKIDNIENMKTMLVFVDGFSKRIGAFIDSLFISLGLEINYIGGGAGSLSMKQKPCLFTNEGLIEDGAVLALLNLESGVGVTHGWKSIGGPFKVTESESNTIKTLDWRPAFDVYRESIEKHSGKTFERDNFFEIAKAYPFGIAKIGTEMVVRDPFVLAGDNSLICVGEIPEGSFVDILNGDDFSLVTAAKEAATFANDSFHHRNEKEIMIFMDCISRVLFLREKFSEEIFAVYDESKPLLGACTIGEIANNGDDYLEFYNKTSVVGIVESL